MNKVKFKLGDQVSFNYPTKNTIGYLLGEGVYQTGEKFWIIGYYDSLLQPVTYPELCGRTHQAGILADKRINMLRFEELDNITSLTSAVEARITLANFKVKSLLNLKGNY